MFTEVRSMAARAVATLAVLTLLSGCTIAGRDFPPPGLFNQVNAVVQDLNISSLDGLVREGRAGVGGGNPPRYVAAVTGDVALPEMQKRLDEAGFVSDGLLEKIGQETWTPSKSSDDFVTVMLRPLTAGDGVAFGQDNSFKMEKKGLAIWVYG